MSTQKTIEYKGYTGSCDFSFEDETLFGKIECINDLVMYSGDTIPLLTASFHEAVEDYLEYCLKIDKEPNKTFSGTFNSRIGAELHKKVYLEKVKTDSPSINETLKSILTEFFDKSGEPHLHIHNHSHNHEAPKTTSVQVDSWLRAEVNTPQLKLVKQA